MIELSSHVIVERTELTEQADLTTFMNDLAGKGKKIKVVENFNSFFSTKNLFAAMDSGDTESLDMIVEKNGVAISAHDMDLIRSYNSLRVNLAERLKPTYAFAKVPEGWSIEKYVTITKASIRRKNGDYSIGVKTLEKVWEAAAKYWLEGETVNKTIVSSISASGYNREVNATPTGLNIGCQMIKRFELEQVALHLGWSFPS